MTILTRLRLLFGFDDRPTFWTWVVFMACLAALCVLNAFGAQGVTPLNKPRFSELTVVAAYNEKDELIELKFKGVTFVVHALEPNGATRSSQIVTIPDFDLIQSRHKPVFTTVAGDDEVIQTTFGEIADDFLAALEIKLKESFPGPLPKRRALRSQNPGAPIAPKSP